MSEPDRIDIAAIARVQDRYAESYDQRRPEEFAAVFTGTGVLELPDGRLIEGREALTHFAREAAGRRASTQHFIRNRRILLGEGDRAWADAHVVAVSRLDDSLRLLVVGRYDDTFLRRDGGWYLSTRRIVALTGADLPSPPG